MMTVAVVVESGVQEAEVKRERRGTGTMMVAVWEWTQFVGGCLIVLAGTCVAVWGVALLADQIIYHLIDGAKGVKVIIQYRRERHMFNEYLKDKKSWEERKKDEFKKITSWQRDGIARGIDEPK